MKNKKWYNVIVTIKNSENIGKIAWFDGDDGNKTPWIVMAKVRSKGNAYAVAEALKQSYKPELYIVGVDY